MSGWREGMSGWSAEQKAEFRARVLDVIASRRARAQDMLNDRTLTFALKCLAVDCQINDVVAILQDMGTRKVITFRMVDDRNAGRRILSEIEITALGQDFVDGNQSEPSIFKF